MKNVTIKAENGKKLGVYRRLSISQKALLEHCKQYGPGIYYAVWPVGENQGDGKPRKLREETRKIYVYADDCDELATEPTDRAGLTVVNRIVREPASPQRAALPDDFFAQQRALIDSVRALVDKVTGDDDEEEEFDDDEEEFDDDDETQPDFMEKAMLLLAQPKYGDLAMALFSPVDDERKQAMIGQAFADKPDLAQSLLSDGVTLVLEYIKESRR